MPEIVIFLPQPRKVNYSGGFCEVNDSPVFIEDTVAINFPSYSSIRLQSEINGCFHITSIIVPSKQISNNSLIISLLIDTHGVVHNQEYHLSIVPGHIAIEAHDERGLFYGCCTLIQIIKQFGNNGYRGGESIRIRIPCLDIQDWPDFPNRGVMLDISRDKVPTMSTIFDLVDMLAMWKINQLQLYTEHTFAYQNHREIWADASPFTATEIQELDAYCRERFIELVPNQNSFGHMERWLNHPSYQHLAEIPESMDYYWGHREGPSCLCPLDPGSIDLVFSLYKELLPNFSSNQFNVGCDETFDVGKGRSKDECNRVGVGSVYFSYLMKIYREVTQRDHKMQFWADMVLAHPALIKDLPKDTIALVWGYEAGYPFDNNAYQIAQAGVPFYLCPGTSSWNSIAGRTENSIENLKNAARSGIKYGAEGYLNTDWGDNGHWQVLPVSYLGMAAGAAYSWCFETNESLDIQEALSQYAFRDRTGVMSRIAYDLGNLYKECGVYTDNSSILFDILQQPAGNWRNKFNPYRAVETFSRIQDQIEQATLLLQESASSRCDNLLMIDEFHITMRLLNHACLRGLYEFNPKQVEKKFLVKDIDEITIDYQSVWLSRNRIGGLMDSLTYFEYAQKEYR